VFRRTDEPGQTGGLKPVRTSVLEDEANNEIHSMCSLTTRFSPGVVLLAFLLLPACGGGGGGGGGGSPVTYTIGGTISGLTGTVVLQLNGGETLSRSTVGGFTL
jgi:hypothetical protein